MKKIILILLAFTFFSFNIAFAANGIKYNSDNNYSFTIPSEWKEIPKSIIEGTLIFLTEETNVEDVAEVPEYAAGFQLESNDYFIPPYILTQEYDRGYMTFEEVKGLFESEDVNFDKIVDELDFISDPSFSEAYFDDERHAIFITLAADTSLREIKALSAVFVGKDEIVHMFLYSDSKEYENDLPFFEDIISSFEFDRGYEYGASAITANLNEKNNQHEKDYNQVFTYIFVGIAAAILLVFVGVGILKK